ncbi:unnamed protein product [Rotaria sordida]|uniref:Uncharacterized protein n=1 Tax=Rotaria sordida TaxID=392033 RepID=A0A815TXY6_9BILA|nr:unnamed protein product [Rotaria sordida]CAF4189699.1 unnamed protein product [Rotaria sordida]
MSRSETKQNTKFYLHSTRNRVLYTQSRYPMTHRLDEFNTQHFRSKGTKDIHHFKYSFYLLLLTLFIGSVFLRMHIQIYNTIFGPFHFKLGDFVGHVSTYNKNYSYMSWFWQKEYVQVELGENNILNPPSKYSVIRQYRHDFSQRDSIATYKQIKNPRMYVKLPTSIITQYHARLPFQFSLFSIGTLQCIVRNLPLNSANTYKGWIEKSFYVQYINDQYTKNATEFNKAVLTKCGILLGYMYRPKGEKVYIRNEQHKFNIDDMAVNMTRPYFSPYLFAIGSLIFLWLFFKSLFYFIRYSIIRLRCDFLHKRGIFSWPLEILPPVAEELWLLNLDVSPVEQLIKFDEYVQRSEHKYNGQLAIIENDEQYLFVALFKINSIENLNILDESSPFTICPVTDIRKITHYSGICYGIDESWIPWPTEAVDEQNYSTWLHEELMECSEFYREK